MKKILLGSILILLLAADSHGLPTLQVEDGHRVKLSPGIKSTVQHEGVHREYYDNGNIKSELGYKNNQLDGRCRLYYKNGNLKRQVHYERGVVEGKAFEFYENGQYKIEGNYKNGIVDHVNKVYYDNGNLYSFMVYNKGQLIEHITLDINGRTIVE